MFGRCLNSNRRSVGGGGGRLISVFSWCELWLLWRREIRQVLEVGAEFVIVDEAHYIILSVSWLVRNIRPGSTKANDGREPKSFLGRVFNFSQGVFCYECNC